MKILLIGHSIIDRFEGDENSLPKPGGIYYSALGLLSVLKSSDEIFLLTSWNQKSFPLFEKVYSNVNLDFAIQVQSLPEVILKTSGEGEREEEYKNLSIKLENKQIIDWNVFDGILVNMITGSDISLDQLQMMKRNFKGLIYFDVHTLSRGIDSNMQRKFRPILNASLWLKNVNIVQANENEVRTLDGSIDEEKCALNICNQGPEVLVITKGNAGAQLYSKFGNNMNSIFVKGEKVKSVNKVGCGDIFGAIFFYSYISTGNLAFSLERANKAGAVAASTANLTELSKMNLND